MDKREVGQLLAVAASVDPRAPRPDPDGLVLRTWHGLLADVPVEAAQKAVYEHYRATKETITPHDIVAAWRRIRADESDRRVNAEQRATFGSQAHRMQIGVTRAVAELAAAKAVRAGEDPDEARATAEGAMEAKRLLLKVACPACGSRPMQPCTKPMKRGRVECPPHPSRQL